MRDASLLLAATVLACAQTAPKLELRNVKSEAVTYKGRACVRLSDDAPNAPDGERLALIAGSEFADGAIEIDLAGDSLPGAPPTARGFAGIAFHVMGGGAAYESFYLRPKNGRAEDQEQRNHSVQYMSLPDFPWARLRQETPGRYESYVDLIAGEWTKVRIEVHGVKARIYVNAAPQPVLIVNDLKHGASHGGLAYWIGPGTVAHFTGLKITQD